MVRKLPYMIALIEGIAENDDREDQIDPTLVSAVREAYVDCFRSLVALQAVGWVKTRRRMTLVSCRISLRKLLSSS
ncbi:MAG: hypothetical protein QF652_01670 [Dehalococcoidia bacterium]|nr:hypothetical protein [Dehalococcoidia bacterium]